ncbi:MAG TPA: hypothetical protein VKA26_08320 [Ignavibacteriaceae bacterium]|nr:hypothetical protein [Ignavibacteriaceae bacterium]
MNTEAKNKKIFRYKVSFYYQSTIIYLIVFILYLLIRGEFVEDSFKLITRDPIIYFFGIIVLISLIALLFNIFKNMHLEITEDSLSFVDRFKTRDFKIDQFAKIRITKLKSDEKNGAFRLIRVKLKNRKRPLVLRPYDYENGKDLTKTIADIKEKLENN